MYHPQGISQTSNFLSYIIEVYGSGEIAVQPNLATVNLGVMTENKELIKAQEQNSVSINNLIQSLLSEGIPNEQIKTFDYRIDSEYDFEQGKQSFRGYKVTHLLEVKIENLALIGRIIDAAVQHGANYVANVQFSVKNKEIHYQRALSAAINSAHKKAKQIANTLKVNLQPTPLSVIEETENTQPFISQAGTYVKGVSTTTIEPGQLMIKAKILTHFRYTL